jgi:hypothetical protein
MKPWIRSMLLAALLAIAGLAGAAEIDVMVQNQYLGTDLTPVITSPPELLNERVVQALENVAASLPAERLERLSGLIAKRQPHAVVLNEAFAYSCVDFYPATPPTEGCGNQRIKGAFVDFLGSTEANLDGSYAVEARVRNFAIEGLPFEIDGYLALLSVVDRDAILVRSDVAPMAQVVPLALGCPGRESLEGCNYIAVPTIVTALGPVTIQRGYLAVDMLVDDSIFRVYGTHLEVRQLIPGPAGEPTRVLQRLQAAELAQTALLFPAAPGTRTLVVGDINSAPTDGFDLLPTTIGPLPPPYAIFVGAGFTDAWTLRPGTATGRGAPLVGNSCCQDEDLANHRSVLYERIDMIFSLDVPSTVRDARLLGESVADKTWPPGFGVWPSDHASVAARLAY